MAFHKREKIARDDTTFSRSLHYEYVDDVEIRLCN